MSKRDKYLVEKVFSLSGAIRYCSVIDGNGKVVAGGMKKGVEPLEPTSEEDKLITQFAILMGTDKDWDAYLGQTEYSLIRKSKVNLLLFPMEEFREVLVSTKGSLSTSEMEIIRKTIDGH